MKNIKTTTGNISKGITRKDDPSGWGAAIQKAESEIVDLKQRQAALRGAIQIFKKKLAGKEPFPA